MEEGADLARAFDIFDEIIVLPRSSRRARRLLSTIRYALPVRQQRYELIIDLQRNWPTRLIRRMSGAAAWGEFDRFSPQPAAERVAQTFERTGILLPSPVPLLTPRGSVRQNARGILERKGWEPGYRLVVLNPAGLWRTRNWPLENYVQFCRHWLNHERVRFLLVGTERLREKARILEGTLGDVIINCAGETTLQEAAGLVSWADLMLTEDSGLLHIGWALGVPMIALFGSSNHRWSAPVGERSISMHSGDLPCGACMEPVCRFDDVHCLTRNTPEMVYERARSLIPPFHQ